MELALNLAWILLASLMCWSWVCFAPKAGAHRRTQIVALAVLILILLPVISVTDDLLVAQNPAETNSCERKDNASAHQHATIHPAVHAILSFPWYSSGRSTRSEMITASAPPRLTWRGMEASRCRPPPSA